MSGEFDGRFRILGPLVIETGGRFVTFRSHREHTILAMLAFEANHIVTIDRLIEAVWSLNPPTTARRQIQICVSAIRRSFELSGLPNMIATHAPGYLLDISRENLDLSCFEHHVVVGRAAAVKGRIVEAVARWRVALDLWDGEPAEGVASPIVRSVALYLVERRVALVEDYAELQLQLGNGSELANELTAVVAKYPLRERLHGLLMRALGQAGRPADALAVYHKARRLFLNELGLEPSKELRAIEKQILGEPTPYSGVRTGWT